MSSLGSASVSQPAAALPDAVVATGEPPAGRRTQGRHRRHRRPLDCGDHLDLSAGAAADHQRPAARGLHRQRAADLAEGVHLENFTDAWNIGNFATTYRNSAILLLLKVPIGVLLSAMLAFALSKLRIRFRRTIMFAVFLGLTIPIYITIVPVFIMLRSMGITDNLLGLVGPYLAFGIPFEVLVLQSFFRQMPDELIEAAKIDGAERVADLLHADPAAVPARPGHRRDPGRRRDLERVPVRPHRAQLRRHKTIPVGLLNFQGQFASNNTGLAAGILIAVVPILLAYVVLQRWIVGGLTAGATKG